MKTVKPVAMRESGAFSAKLRALRMDTGISLRHLARDVDISPAFLSDIELGRRMPSRAVVCRIAKALSVEADVLLKYDPREGMNDIIATANANPNSRSALVRLCQSLNTGKVTTDEVERLAAGQH
jgi:transcriptional regulator with XRE-family HTH domain